MALAGGRGSTGERMRLLSALLAAATEGERDFLARLIFGELRQGALGGIMADSGRTKQARPVSSLRQRDVMFLGDEVSHPRGVDEVGLVGGRSLPLG